MLLLVAGGLACSPVDTPVTPVPFADQRFCTRLAGDLREVMGAGNPAEAAQRRAISYRNGRVEVEAFFSRREGDFADDWADVARRYDFRIGSSYRYGASGWIHLERLCDLADDLRVERIETVTRPIRRD